MGNGDGGAEPCVVAGMMTVVPAAPDVEDPDPLPVIAAAEPPLLSDALVEPTGPSRGVAGALGEGDALSTIHILWLCVATSLAMTLARVW